MKLIIIAAVLLILFLAALLVPVHQESIDFTRKDDNNG
jgi:hypothetical protein